MFPDDLANDRVAQFQADISPFSGVIALSIQADSLGNVMEQGPGQDESSVWQICSICPALSHAGQQCFSRPGHGQGVGPDIVEHTVAIHQAQALSYGRNSIAHISNLSGKAEY